MINEQRERATLNKMSDLEYQKNDTEMMRYRPNGLSHKLGLLGMACSILAAFICLNSMAPTNIQVLIIIMINIVILLGGFLAAEKAKSYSKTGSIALITFGGVCAARIFYIPLIILINYGVYQDCLAKGDTTSDTYNGAVANLGATITSKDEGRLANAFLPSSGTFRGVFAIVFFALAAAAFITAGVIGYMRSQKLSKYLDSINEKN